MEANVCPAYDEDTSELKLEVLVLKNSIKNRERGKRALNVVSALLLLSTTQAQKNGFPGSPNMVKQR